MHVVADHHRPRTHPQLRDQIWLQEELDYLWRHRFADVPRVSSIEVSFLGCWKNRLGVISFKPDNNTTHIGINSLLRLPDVPYYVTTVTIAHELVHYSHGFGSPLPRTRKHPHRGRIVEKEITRRGLSEEYQMYRDWVSDQWFDFYASCLSGPVKAGNAYHRGSPRFNSHER